MNQVTPPPLTEAQARALAIIEVRPGIRPQQFSRLMWPQADGHKRSTKVGPKGATRGGGMWLAAGGYLGKLAAKKLIPLEVTRERYQTPGYSLTPEGKIALDETRRAP